MNKQFLGGVAQTRWWLRTFQDLVSCMSSSYYRSAFQNFSLRLIHFYLKGRFKDRKGKTQRNIFHPVVHSLNGLFNQSWADLKLQGRSFFLNLNVGSRAQELGTYSSHFLGHTKKLDRKWNSKGMKQCSYVMLVLAGKGLASCITMPGPCTWVFSFAECKTFGGDRWCFLYTCIVVRISQMHAYV